MNEKEITKLFSIGAKFGFTFKVMENRSYTFYHSVQNNVLQIGLSVNVFCAFF